MNNFNKVFETVKKHCQENGSVSGNGQFQNISSEVGVPSERLHFYLECIEHTGVIQYNRETETVNLTKKGEEALRVFP